MTHLEIFIQQHRENFEVHYQPSAVQLLEIMFKLIQKNKESYLGDGAADYRTLNKAT